MRNFTLNSCYYCSVSERAFEGDGLMICCAMMLVSAMACMCVYVHVRMMPLLCY